MDVGLLGATGSNVNKDLHHDVIWTKFSALLLCHMLGQILVWSYSKTTPEPIQLVTLNSFFGQTIWPAYSPDLNPIEHLWDFLKRIAHAFNIGNMVGLQAAIRCEWNDLPVDLIGRLIGSMRRKCTVVIRAMGGHTNDFEHFERELLNVESIT